MLLLQEKMLPLSVGVFVQCCDITLVHMDRLDLLDTSSEMLFIRKWSHASMLILTQTKRV